MSTTRRRAHTRRTPSGKRTRVRSHQVNYAASAAGLWEASGLARFFNPRAGWANATRGAEWSKKGNSWQRRVAGAGVTTFGVVQLLGFATGRTGWALGLVGLAAVFAGIGLWKGQYKPKPRSARQDHARNARGQREPVFDDRPVYRYPNEPKPKKKARRISPPPPLGVKQDLVDFDSDLDRASDAAFAEGMRGHYRRRTDEVI